MTYHKAQRHRLDRKTALSLLLIVLSITSAEISIHAFQCRDQVLSYHSTSFHFKCRHKDHFRETKRHYAFTSTLSRATSRHSIFASFSHASSKRSPTSIHPSPNEEKEVESSPTVGQIKQRMYQSASRESRISALEILRRSDPDKFSDAQQAELNGLLRASSKFEEPYDETLFEEHHLEFKKLHNEAFLALTHYCEKRRNELAEKNGREREDGVNVFFLDGPTGGTTSVMVQGGLDSSQCFVANRHASTCGKLRRSGGGPLPDDNVVHATATEALRKVDVCGDDDGIQNGPFAHLDFAAYYFDGCGGYVPQIIDMISEALNKVNSEEQLKTTAIGFSLLGGNKDVVDKELSICQVVNTIAKKNNMKMFHVLDDPNWYGISKEIRKVGGAEGQTFTSWLILEVDG